MKTQKADLLHGAALTQIVKHPSFKALNKPWKEYGHYQVNADIEVFCKYLTTNHISKKKKSWCFTFQPEELSRIKEAQDLRSNRLFCCLICNDFTVCVLNMLEINQLLNFSERKAQSITVDVPHGGSCRVSGTNGELKRCVPHNAFPNKIFDHAHLNVHRLAA